VQRFSKSTRKPPRTVLAPVQPRGTASPTITEEHRMEVLENRILEKIFGFGFRTEEVTGE
jgi:hypothetical protein